jgi:helicase MOV-10
VAITRAQALLIVIGDPEVLGKDELWRTFLEYINSREGWTGKVHKWDAAESDSVPGYVVESRKGSVLYGEEFMDRKSEKIYRSSGSNGG